MKIESTLIFLNVTSQFNVLNGLCTGEAIFQAIITENKTGKMEIDCIEPMDITNIVFAGNKLDEMGYQEFNEWCGQVDTLFGCDISNLIHNDAEANLDKKALTKYASKIQLPQN